jgi:prepilin-type N-terminal cleavage/methylation domain-containing protein
MENTMVKHTTHSSSGFSLLEVVVAIFLIAIILGSALLVIASHMRVAEKANSIMIATALAQYTIEEMRNIDFPPVYGYGDTTQDGYASKLQHIGHYPLLETDPPYLAGPNLAPPEFSDKYLLLREIFAYDANGTFLSPPVWTDINATDTYLWQATLLKIHISIYKKHGKALLLRTITYRTKNDR